MKFTALLIILSFSSSSFAAVKIAPTADTPTCFSREYTEEHMRNNPAQLLEKMFVKVSYKNSKTDDQTWTWMAGEVIGVKQGVYFGNTAGCETKPDGSLNCQIECDGGSYRLRQSVRFKGDVNFMTEGFPLFKNRMYQDDMEEPNPVESFRLGGQQNGIYRLVPVDAEQCDSAIERVLNRNLMGGC